MTGLEDLTISGFYEKAGTETVKIGTNLKHLTLYSILVKVEITTTLRTLEFDAPDARHIQNFLDLNPSLGDPTVVYPRTLRYIDLHCC